MHPLLQQIVEQYSRRKVSSTIVQDDRRRRQRRIQVEHELSDGFSLLLGILMAVFGLEGFLIPNAFIDGGITGVSLIVHELSDWPLPVLITLFNLPFIWLAYTAISRRFAIKSILGIVFFSLALWLIEVPVVTEDKILVAAFGGFFLGLGIGLAIRGGAILDGTEVLAIFLSRQTSLTVGNIILLFNLLIFLSAAYLLSVEVALYAILTYVAASKTVDFTIDGIEEYTGVTIISARSDEIRDAITEKLGRGCTIYRGIGGYSVEAKQPKDLNIVYTVITRLEVSTLKTEIDKIDQKAFIVMSAVKDTRGGMIKKKPISRIK